MSCREAMMMSIGCCKTTMHASRISTQCKPLPLLDSHHHFRPMLQTAYDFDFGNIARAADW